MFKPVTGAIEKLIPQPQVSTPVADLLKLDGGDDGGGEAMPLKTEEEQREEIQLDEPGIVYKQALTDVPVRFRDDGLLGLDTANHRIGDYVYSVDGDTLKVHGNNEEYEYEIDDIDLWKLLLVKNPQRINLNLYDKHKQLLPFVEKYREIATELNLTNAAAPGFKKRTKYKIAILEIGSGFLFTTHPPANTLLIPSDNPGLLRALYVALAELRAGNSSMRNIVVPLSQEARRKGILPENLLSADEETWVFA